jgi:cytochrome P450
MKESTPVLSSLITETLRLHTDPNSFRIAQEDCTVNLAGVPTRFRKGDSVFLLSSFDQMAPSSLVPEPHVYDPQRWALFGKEEKTEEGFVKAQILAPFGGGKHLCPGRMFALLEMQVGVAFCLANYDFELACKTAVLPPKVADLSAPVNQAKSSFKVRYRKCVT